MIQMEIFLFLIFSGIHILKILKQKATQVNNKYNWESIMLPTSVSLRLLSDILSLQGIIPLDCASSKLQSSMFGMF